MYTGYAILLLYSLLENISKLIEILLFIVHCCHYNVLQIFFFELYFIT